MHTVRSEEFRGPAPTVPVVTAHVFSLSQANEALTALREGKLTGAVLVPDKLDSPRG